MVHHSVSPASVFSSITSTSGETLTLPLALTPLLHFSMSSTKTKPPALLFVSHSAVVLKAAEIQYH